MKKLEFNIESNEIEAIEIHLNDLQLIINSDFLLKILFSQNKDQGKEILQFYVANLRKLLNILKEQECNWITQIAAYVDLEYDARANYDWFFNEKFYKFRWDLLKKLKQIRDDAYIYANINFDFCIKKRVCKINYITFLPSRKYKTPLTIYEFD